MKVRILFGLGGFAFVLLALYVFPPVVFGLTIMLLCGEATREILATTKLVKNRRAIQACVGISLIYAGTFLYTAGDETMRSRALIACSIALLVLLFTILLHNHETMRFEEVAIGFFGALFLPYLLLSLLRLFQMQHGSLLVLMPLLAAWGSDTFAYFSGRLLGKHKLAPIISPKKTVEGAVGGVFGGALCVATFSIILSQTLSFVLPIWTAALLGAVGAVIGQLGDLSFSIVKRQTKIKDYAAIFPGHGGVLDRFDSVIFVAPVVEAVLLLYVGS